MVALPAPSDPPRLRLRVRGLVQGVGFRPHVYRLAHDLGLTGWVLNDGGGVLAEVQGARASSFVRRLRSGPPPLARIETIEVEPVAPAPERDFRIVESGAGPIRTMITPDVAVCDDCLAELLDPGDRRHRHPFLNCTNCGPRFTITERLPYDRARTSMAGFAMCAACAREYQDPRDRRFHAQPTACPDCGPRLEVSPATVVHQLLAGRIVAIKGLGGFHLACDARDQAAVERLRARKQREEKPFAVMVANLATARVVAEVGPAEAALLSSPERPIVLVRKRGDPLADAIAPGLAWQGLLLPYTPLHHLLFHEAAGRPGGPAWLAEPQELVLVMTSANPRDQPLVIDDAEAARRLDGIADLVVGHDRAILQRADDSLARVVDGAPALIRRGRGHVPRAIPLAREVPEVLAVGGLLKSTICVTRGREAFLSQHIGDLTTPETLAFFEHAIGHLLHILQVTPVVVAHDLHPDFASTRHAERLGLPTVAVQHHHAHIAAIAAEHQFDGPLLGLALDGFGLGPDGRSWGGELLLVEGARYRRLGHLAELAQPGGDQAARQPWRMGAAALHRLGRGDEITRRFGAERGAAMVARMLAGNVQSPTTSSCGRLFDAACGLLGVQPHASFEGQAAMCLEGLVTTPRVLDGGWRIEAGVLDLDPLLAALVERDPASGADLFHGTLCAALADWVEAAATASGISTVALGGGCLLNHVLAEGLIDALATRRLRPLIARQAPPNDGGLSLGQAWVAAHQQSG